MDITGFIGEYLDFQPWSTIAMLCMLLLGTMALATRTTGYLEEGLYRDVPIDNPWQAFVLVQIRLRGMFEARDL